MYRITCNNCSLDVIETKEETHNYIGYTRTSVHARMVDHQKKQRAKNSSGPLYRHDLYVYKGVHQQNTTEVIGKVKKILRLYNLESKFMEMQTPIYSMNDRQERS